MTHFKRNLLLASIVLTMGATDALAQRSGRGSGRGRQQQNSSVQRQRPKQQLARKQQSQRNAQ